MREGDPAGGRQYSSCEEPTTPVRRRRHQLPAGPPRYYQCLCANEAGQQRINQDERAVRAVHD